MIVHGMMYNGEVDALDVLLHTENPVVDKFVLCESTVDHQGNEKDLYWQHDQRDYRFADVLDKIEYLVYEPEIKPGDWATKECWKHEESQRNFLNVAFNTLGTGDWILIGDCDEVYHPDALVKMLYDHPTCAWTVMNCQWFNCRRTKEPLWPGPLVVPGKLSDHIDSMLTRYKRGSYIIAGPETILGWHLSYMGDTDYLIRKFNTIVEGSGWRSGWETNIPYSEDMLRERHSKRMWVGGTGGTEGEVLTLDNNIIPPYVLENQERFEHLIWKEDE